MAINTDISGMVWEYPDSYVVGLDARTGELRWGDMKPSPMSLDQRPTALATKPPADE